MSLQVDSCAATSNASPFPSPGSSFLTPPMPDPHEFALPPPSTRLSKRRGLSHDGDVVEDGDGGEVSAGDERLELVSSTGMIPSTSMMSTPTPTPTSTTTTTTTTNPSPPRPNLSLTEISTSTTQTPTAPSPTTPITSKHLSRTSLHSNRPAPHSPIPSRRTSTTTSILSARSTTTTNNNNNNNNNNRQSSLSFMIKIRDYAFSKSDDRHFGRGPDAPGKRGSGGGAESESRRSSGWGGFKWGFPSRFSWSFSSTTSGTSSSSSSSSSPTTSSGKPIPGRRASGLVNGSSYDDDDDEDDEDEGENEDYTPSKQDFDRNFSTPSSPSPPPPEPDIYPYPDEPLPPGYYKALYPFIPEGTAEMGLKEDQIVRIVGRGGGVGWAIALKEGGAGGEGFENAQALVPESYLEFVRPFEEEEVERTPRSV